jgi:methyl-accepting chemotaxis protein
VVSTTAEAIDEAAASVREIAEALRGGEAAMTRMDAAWRTVTDAADGFGRSARQARVLAINASIEAASIDRTGGFAIVADRVRALSVMTSETARDVETIALQSIDAVAETMVATRRTREALLALDELLTVLRASADAGRPGVLQRVAATVAEVRALGEDVDAGAARMLQSTDRIETLVNRLVDIAGDAQLLAINAAIEAARAGERGLGFTVIADGIAALSRETGDTSGVVIGTVVKLRDRTARLRAGSARQGEAMQTVKELLERALGVAV